MRFDFWNNPLIVTAFRYRQRRAAPANTLMAYPMALLLLIGVAVPYFDPEGRREWPRIAFYALMGLQFVVSGIWAGSATSSSLKSEVLNQTLDFQRITCLSPRQILLGKLLGEPAMAYFLGMSTFPLGVLCWALGGVSLEVLLLMYVNLFTHTLMCGACGLVIQLELKEDKTVEGGVVALLALPASLPIFYALSLEEPWRVGVLALFPLLHLLQTYHAFHMMERQLANALNPTFSKTTAYLLLALVDVVTATVLAAEPLAFGRRCALFCLVHLLASLVLIATVTP